MMRKRACASADPKPEKRCKVSPQTKSVRKPANNEEKVQLDYLVVEKIASLTELKFAPDLFQELVSPTFASALRSFYSKKKLKLSFSTPYDDDDDDDTHYDYDHDYPTVILLSISGLSQESEEDIKIPEENLSRAMQQIFARFRRIQLDEMGVDNERVAAFLIDALNCIHDVAIETLRLDLRYDNLLGCQELIEKLSASLQALHLRIYLTSEDQTDDDDDEDFDVDQMDDNDDDDESSKGFWQTVASYAQLVRLDVEFNYDLYEEDYGYLEASDALLMRISNGLKRSKVST
uniref:Uncharacterized protein n=1 Tax=Plectus sambesii TaxID=2011161 RepID=A0A914X9V2_9BILA